ncbi:MAG: hypothetical protein ABIJ96_03275 [Elusimicrobiota bacterium]
MIIATKSLIVSVFRGMVRALSIVFALYLVLFFVVMGLSYVEKAETYPALNYMIIAEKAIENPAASLIRENLPHKFEGNDLAPWMFIMAVFVLWILTEVQKSRLLFFREVLAQEQRKRETNAALAAERKERLKAQQEAMFRLEREATERAERAAKERASQAAAVEAQRQSFAEVQRLAEAKRAAEAQAGKEAHDAMRLQGEKLLGQARDRVLAGGASKAASRDELLELMAQAKKKLEEQKKSLSFLAIDVVDSTGMKVGEDPAIAARDFTQYKKVVEKAIADNKGLKAAWTPDGVMICFPSAEAAVGAAKQVIGDLEHFNKHVKAMSRDFKVRCGINAGNVLFDETIPMEEMSDRSIDIAGHMQKYAGANSIFIGKHVIEAMRTTADFTPVERQVDGCDVYQWTHGSN